MKNNKETTERQSHIEKNTGKNTKSLVKKDAASYAHLSNPSYSSVSIMEHDRSNVSDSNEYDRPEKLSTKQVKVLKKITPKPEVRIAGDDSDSLAMYPMTNIYTSSTRKTHHASSEMVFSSADNKQTSSSSGMDSDETTSLASNTNISKRSFYPSKKRHDKLPSRHTLASGLAFIYMVKPPDGGWGWVILVTSFLSQVIVDGIILNIGILLPFMMEEFHVNKALIVLVAAVQIGTYFLSGSIAGALINSFGFRPVALSGAVIACIALALASYAESLTVLILCYSIIGGVGLSLLWTSSQLVVAYYFEVYRPLANGFTCSGAGLGLVVFSIIDTLLIDIMDWRNIMRVYILFLLLVFFMGMTFIEVKPVPVGVLHRKHLVAESSSEEYYGAVHNYLKDPSHMHLSKSSVFSRFSTAEHAKQNAPKKERWFHKLFPCLKPRPIVPSDTSESYSSDEIENDFIVRPDPLQRQDIYYTGPVDYSSDKDAKWERDVELFGTDKNVASTAYNMAHIHDYDKKKDAKRHKDTGREVKKTRRIIPLKVTRAFALLFDFSLIKNFEFRFLLASAFLFPMGLNIPFVYTKARTTIPPEYSMFISPCIGFSNFLVRIACGFLAFRYKRLANSTYGVGLVIGGSAVFASSLYGKDVIWFQYTYGLLYGVAPAVYSTLRALLYVYYLGLSKLTNAFGLTGLSMGLGVFTGTSIAGVLIEATGGYAAAFAFSGMCIICSGAIVLLLPQIVKRRKPPLLAPTVKSRHNIKRAR